MGHETLRVKSSATNLSFSGSPEAGTTVLVAKKDTPTRPTDESVRAKAGEASGIIEQALGDLRRVANAEGDRPLNWWLDRFTKLVRARADAAARVDAIVSGGEDVLDPQA